jgi:hypothetical protein
MAYVNFITDDHFRNCTQHVFDSYKKAYDLLSSTRNAIGKNDIFKSKLFSNKIDPFKMAFDIKVTSLNDWVQQEIYRQLNKSVEQTLGEFHQKILGGVDGWTDLGTGQSVDLVNDEETIYIELKNKYNTCSADALNAVRHKLEDITSQPNRPTAYWAYIIASTVKRSGNEVWVKKNFNTIDAVKKIWGDNVYELVTGNGNDLFNLYKALPEVINEVKTGNNEDIKIIIDTIISEIEPHLSTITEQIYDIVFVDD